MTPAVTAVDVLPRVTPKLPVRVCDLYAGIGGFHLAFAVVGGQVVVAAKTDPTARLTYTVNFADRSPQLFQDDLLLGDVHQLDLARLPDFDVLCAGFPCQPFSEAGVRRGFADNRGLAIYDIVRVLEAKRPAAFLLENVRGLVTHDGGRTFAAVRRLLTRRAGYSLRYQVLSAASFGLPQSRPRLFMVGFRDRGVSFAFPEPVPLRFTMSDVLGGSCDRDIGYTVLASRRGKPHGTPYAWDAYIVDGQKRHLGVPEARRMQGIPDWFWLPEQESAAMRLIGNSVAIPVVEALAAAIVTALNGSTAHLNPSQARRAVD